MLISLLSQCRETVNTFLHKLKKIHQTVFVQNNRPPIEKFAEELKQLLAEFPENFTVKMILANLLRDKGDLDQAIKMRKDLLTAQGKFLSPLEKSRLFYELGRDYKAGGFLGRAKKYLEQANALKKRSFPIIEALAETESELGNLEQCVKLYGQLGQRMPQGHFLVKLAREAKEKGEAKKYQHYLNRALATAPDLAEGYIEKCFQALQEDDVSGLANWFDLGLKKLDKKIHFLFFESLLPHLSTTSCRVLLAIVKEIPFDLTIFFYRSFLHHLVGENSEAKACLRACLKNDPEFWPARLELIALECQDISLPSELHQELDILLGKGRGLKKFFCAHCGLKREQIFLQCPRCKQWQTICLVKQA